MGRPGGFVAALRDGTSLAHVVEHVALAIQRLAGVHVFRGLTQPASKAGLYHVVYAYRQEDVGRAAGQLAVEYLNNLLQDCAANHDLTHQVEDVIRIADRLAYGPSTLDIVSDAGSRYFDCTQTPPWSNSDTGGTSGEYGRPARLQHPA